MLTSAQTSPLFKGRDMTDITVDEHTRMGRSHGDTVQLKRRVHRSSTPKFRTPATAGRFVSYLLLIVVRISKNRRH